MNNIYFIATKELKSNKKMTIIMILSIIVVTILINSIATLALSYQEYIINLSRNKENWEVLIDNIRFEDIKYIENDKNVKQISVVQDIGISENSYTKGFTELIHIKAYDNNALENLNIKLKNGRLPENSNEIVINEDMNFDIGENIIAKIDNIELTYIIVGTLENTDFDEFNYKELTKINGAITLCDKTNIGESTFVSASIISNNISDIYNTAERMKNEIYSKNSSSNIGIKYNEELLSYACVARDGSEFQTNIIIVIGLLIGIISISSIALIYTIFNITMGEKKKYIASLSSVGATKKQIFKIYLVEGLIITAIAIPIGLLISFGIDGLLINILNNLFKSIQSNILNTTLQPSKDVDIYLVYSLFTVCISIILVTIIVLLSILSPIINASKTTIIDMMRKTRFNKVGKSPKKVPKVITKMFKAPGELAYKNIKRSRYKFVTMIISLTVSIVLFITITGYIENLSTYNKVENTDYNYLLDIYRDPEQKDYSEEILGTLKEFGLIDSIYGVMNLNPLNLYPENNKINDSLKVASQKIPNLLGCDEPCLFVHILTFDDKYYSEYLKQIGMDRPLENGDCILVNYSNYNTKYYDELYLTNYLQGDKLVCYTMSRHEEEEIQEMFLNTFGTTVKVAKNKEVELNIGFVTNIIPKGSIQGLYGEDLNLIVNSETFKDLFFKTIGVKADIMFGYHIYSSKPDKLDEMVSSLQNKYSETTRIYSTNLFTEQQSNANEKLIKEILLYSFLFLICILSIINVFNIIVSNITSRNTEFAELKAIGMSKKQINKMFRLEGIFYGSISVIIGFAIGIAILYVLYKRMLNTDLYAFTVSLPILISTIITVFSIIFISIWYAKKQLNNENISDIIKERI